MKHTFLNFRTLLTHKKTTKEELLRRLEEVSLFKSLEITSQDQARSFFSRIADYVNYLKNNPLLSKYVEELKRERENLSINRELIKEGDEIIIFIEKEFKSILRLLKKNGTRIIPHEEIFPSGRSFINASPQQSLSLEVIFLRSFLAQKDKYVGDLPKRIAGLHHIIFSAEGLGLNVSKHKKKLEEQSKTVQRYKLKIKKQQVYIAYLRFEDFESLDEIWKYYYSDESLSYISSFTFWLKDILQEENFRSTLTIEEKKKLIEKKDEYLLSLSRFNNYLVDKLEATNVLADAWKWIWDNFGKTIISILIMLMLTYVLKNVFKVTAPTDFLKDLLR